MNTISKTNFTKVLLFVCLFLTTIFSFGCSNSTKESTDICDQCSYSVIDARGKKLDFVKKPQRIVSCYVYGDEILLDLVNRDRIAGLSKWVHDADLSMATKQAKDVPTIVENNPEAILALKPDLVLLPSSSTPENIASLEDVGLQVYVYPAATRLSNIPVTIKAMGEAVGESRKANSIILAMQKKLSDVKQKIVFDKKDEKIALLFLRFGAIGGEGCIFNDIMTAAGVRDGYNIARPVGSESIGSRVLGKEEVVKVNPDFLIIANWNQGGAYKSSDEHLLEIYSDPALVTVKAIKNKKAIVIPQGYVNCLSHHAADSVEMLFKAINN